jgi:nucleolar protein 58
VDALADDSNTDIGLEYKAKVDARLRQLEGGEVLNATKTGTAVGPSSFETAPLVKMYNDATDHTMDTAAETGEADDKDKKKKKKKVSWIAGL